MTRIREEEEEVQKKLFQYKVQFGTYRDPFH